MRDFIIAIGSTVVIFYAPARWAIFALFVLLIIDTYWGIRSVKYRGAVLTSSRFNDLFAKVTGYFIFVAFGLIIEREFGLTYAVWIACAMPIFSEIKSIDENQKTCGKVGIFKRLDDLFNFAKSLKNRKDELRK